MNTTSNPNYTIHTALDHGEGGIVYQQDETFLQGMTPVPSAATSDYLLTEQPQDLGVLNLHMSNPPVPMLCGGFVWPWITTSSSPPPTHSILAGILENRWEYAVPTQAMFMNAQVMTYGGYQVVESILWGGMQYPINWPMLPIPRWLLV